MIDAYAMSQIYWSRVKKHSIKLVTEMIDVVKSRKAKLYWSDVLSYLNIRGKMH